MYVCMYVCLYVCMYVCVYAKLFLVVFLVLLCVQVFTRILKVRHANMTYTIAREACKHVKPSILSRVRGADKHVFTCIWFEASDSGAFVEQAGDVSRDTYIRISVCDQVGKPEYMRDAAHWYRQYLGTRASEKDVSRPQIGKHVICVYIFVCIYRHTYTDVCTSACKRSHICINSHTYTKVDVRITYCKHTYADMSMFINTVNHAHTDRRPGNMYDHIKHVHTYRTGYAVKAFTNRNWYVS
jgi:hypothetical protein